MLSDTIEELRAVALAAGDASGHFPAMYARVTDRIGRAAAAGEFGDAPGMVQFAREFAGWYLRPRAGTPPVPGAWRACWDVADDRTLLVVQHLLLGINAHVNHDLGQVVVALADERQTPPSAMRADFDAVNAVLAATMPEVIADLGRTARWVNRAAAWGADRWFHFSLSAARDQAWRFAIATHPMSPPERARAVAELDRLVCVLAYLVTRPVRPVRWLVPAVRRLEPDDAPAVTRALLGHLV